MSIRALRSAVTAAGGSPTQYTHVGLLRELVTAWGGTPTYFDIVDLLRQAITVAGGSPTGYNQTALLRQLSTTLGGTPTSFRRDDLWDLLATLAGNLGVDAIADPFTFTDVSNATTSTQYTSNAITVAGLGSGVSVPVSVSGGTYSKNGGAFTSALGTAQNGDAFAVQQTSSASNGTASDTTLTIGAVSDTYTVTTAAAAGLNTGDFYVAPTAAGTGDGLSAANAMSWASHSAQSAATLSGKTVVVMPGTFSLKTIGINGNAATVTYIPRDPTNPPVFDQLTINACSKLKLQQLKIVTSAWSATSGTNNPAVIIAGVCGDLTFDRNTIRGSYRGDTNADIDVVSELPEYACIAAVMSGGAVTSLVIKHSTVGDLLADGTYPLTLNETAGTGFSATFTVSAGIITGTTLTSGGSGYTMTLHEASRLTWTGQQRLIDYLPRGIAAPAGGTCTSLTLTDNAFSNLADATKLNSPSNSIVVTGNSYDRIYSAAGSFGLTGSTAPPTTTTISDNYGTRFFYDSYDAGNPHGDFFHLFMNDLSSPFTPSDWVATFERNILTTGASRGSTIGLLMGDCPGPGAVYRLRCVGNLIVSDYTTSGFNFDGLRDSYFYRNTVARSTPNNPPNSGALSINLPSPALSANAVGKSFAGNNVADILSNNNSTTISETGTVNLGINGATVPYTTIWPNSGNARTTAAEALAAYTPTGIYVGKGAYADSYLNYTARATDVSLEPTFVNFDALTGQTTSTAVSSAWCRVLGGPASQSWSVTGGTAQVADDASGTNATAAAASGTVALGKFMRVNVTTSGSGSTTVTGTLTINGYSYDFNATTASVANFATVDNQAAAYSTMGMVPSETGLKRFLIACRFKNDNVVSGANVFSDSTLSGIRLFLASVSAYRFQLFSGGVTHRSTLVPTTGWETHIMAVDFTQTAASSVSKWVCNGVDVPQAASTVAGNGTGTQSFTTSNLISSTFGMFARPSDGTGLLDGEGAFFWMHWGDATFTLPDIESSAVQNKFTADQINLTDGSGPLGFQPKLFFTGNAASWNAGLANKGSVAITLAKIAGTYV